MAWPPRWRDFRHYIQYQPSISNISPVSALPLTVREKTLCICIDSASTLHRQARQARRSRRPLTNRHTKSKIHIAILSIWPATDCTARTEHGEYSVLCIVTLSCNLRARCHSQVVGPATERMHRCGIIKQHLLVYYFISILITRRTDPG